MRQNEFIIQSVELIAQSVNTVDKWQRWFDMEIIDEAACHDIKIKRMKHYLTLVMAQIQVINQSL